MRVVLDTNVLISAVVYGGNPRQILQAAIAGTIIISISDALIQEFQAVLQRPRFGLSAQFVQSIVTELTAVAEWVAPKKRHRVVQADPSDNLVIDCAVAAAAEYLVTGDRHLLLLGTYGKVQIITPQEFVSKLGRQ